MLACGSRQTQRGGRTLRLTFPAKARSQPPSRAQHNARAGLKRTPLGTLRLARIPATVLVEGWVVRSMLRILCKSIGGGFLGALPQSCSSAASASQGGNNPRHVFSVGKEIELVW